MARTRDQPCHGQEALYHCEACPGRASCSLRGGSARTCVAYRRRGHAQGQAGRREARGRLLQRRCMAASTSMVWRTGGAHIGCWSNGGGCAARGPRGEMMWPLRHWILSLWWWWGRAEATNIFMWWHLWLLFGCCELLWLHFDVFTS